MLSLKRNMSLVLVVLMILPLGLTVSAEIAPNVRIMPSSLNIISPEAAEEIERLLVKNSDLEAMLSNESVSRSSTLEIQREIDNNNKRIEELGVSSPSNALLEDLIHSSMPDDALLLRDGWHPSELVEEMSCMYDLSASYATTHEGRAQYHLNVKHKGEDPYLHVVKTDHFYDGIPKGSTEAHNWAHEIIEIYAQRLASYAINKLSPVLSVLPYEVLGIAQQPNDSAIYSSQDATVVTLNTTSTQKFVFVYDDYNSGWYYALSTNRVSCSITVTQALSINGRSYNNSKDYNNINEFNEFFNAAADANRAYELGTQFNTCISEISGYSTSKDKDMVSCKIFTPYYIYAMA